MLMNLLHFVISIWVPLVCAVVIVAVLPLVAGYIVLMERKVMADMQARLGPMRVGPHGLLQPIADAVKLLIKEDIIPDEADKAIFWFAPLISVTAGMLAMSALAIGPWFQIADLNVGLLFIVGISALGIFGIVLGGWSSNSHYSLLGALRSAAQLVSYETAAGMAIVGAIAARRNAFDARNYSGAGRLRHVVCFCRAGRIFFIYVVASIAETNRAPFDLPEAESELVAGYMTEYSGFRWALYFLAEYTNMVVVASIATTLFLGGWLRPFAGTPAFNFLDYVPSLLMLGVGGYCFYRAPKQPVKVQSLFMVAVGLLMILVAIILAAPLVPAREFASRIEAGIARRVLVPVESRAVHLSVHVAPVYVPALPVRSVDAPGLAIPDSTIDRQRDGDRRRPGAAPAVGMEPLDGVSADDDADAGGGRVAGLGGRKEER